MKNVPNHQLEIYVTQPTRKNMEQNAMEQPVGVGYQVIRKGHAGLSSSVFPIFPIGVINHTVYYSKSWLKRLSDHNA